MVELLVGDGPSNRYALICKQCASHNGMALKEEFEYLTFRCCYCYSVNPARKKRLQAPKLLQDLQTTIAKAKTSDTSESDKNSPSDTETDEDNIMKTKEKTAMEVKMLYDFKDKKLSDNERVSDFDKLSDFELKVSDNELCSTESENVEAKASIVNENVEAKASIESENLEAKTEGSQ